MKKLTSKSLQCILAALGLSLGLLANNAKAQALSLYWDINGPVPGAGGAAPSGTWEGINWSSDPGGARDTDGWREGDWARFAACADAIGSYRIRVNANHVIYGMVMSTGTGTVSFDGPGVLGIGDGSCQFFASGTLEINCALSGGGQYVGLAGTVQLYGTNTYSGGSLLNGAVTGFNNNNSFGTGPITPMFVGPTPPGYSTLASSTISIIQLPNNFVINTAMAGITFSNGPAPVFCSGNWDLQQTLYLRENGFGTAPLFLIGVLSGAGGVNVSADNDGIVVLGPPLNTYTGPTTIGLSSAGSGVTLAVSSLNSVTTPAQQPSSSLGTPSSVANGTIGFGAGTRAGLLRYIGAGETTDRVIDLAGTTGGATLQIDGGPVTFTSDCTASGLGAKHFTLQGTNTANNTIAGRIVDSSAGATTLIKAQANTWVLSGANTYSGNTMVTAGTLAQGAANVIPSGSGKGSFAVSSGATFDLGGFDCSINGFGTSAGTIDNKAGAGTYNLTIGNNNGGGTHSGVIKNTSGTLALAKVGTGTITLGGANTYSGMTTVVAGTLEISSANGLASPTVTVASLAALKLDSSTALQPAANLVLNLGTPSVNLNFTGASQISSLSFDGGATTATRGSWGAPGSGALNTDSRLTGTGILNVGVLPLTLSLTSSANPSTYGDSATLTAAATGPGPTPIPTGTVTFKEGATTLGTANLDVTGHATLPTSGLSVGTHSITVTCGGDSNYGWAVSSVLSQVVNPASSSTALASTLNPSTAGVSVTFTATVSSSGGTPTGNVVFRTNSVVLATVALSGGHASTATADLPLGTNTVTAQYAAQANWQASSGSLDQVVNSAVTLSTTNVIESIVNNGDGTFTLNLLGTPGASYYVVASADATATMLAWTALTDSTNLAGGSGRWSFVVSNAAPAFYRAIAVNPAP